MKVTVGRIYAYHLNGNRRAREIVRVIGDGVYARIKGPQRIDTPYNFAFYEYFHHAKRSEIQDFIEQMPITL